MEHFHANEKMTDTKDDVDVVESGSFDDRTTPVLDQNTVDPVYQAKAHVLNNAIQQIGMGRYQWELVSGHLFTQNGRTARACLQVSLHTAL